MGEKFDVKGGHFIRRKALFQTKMCNGKQGDSFISVAKVLISRGS
jgi:hypothetical protein